MGELEERLNSILSDPEQMRRISSLAQTLMGGEAGGDAPPSAPRQEAGSGDGLSGALGSLLAPRESSGDRTALLEALKPWLSEKRRRKLSRAMRLAQMAGLARIAMGEAGNGEAL